MNTGKQCQKIKRQLAMPGPTLRIRRVSQSIKYLSWCILLEGRLDQFDEGTVQFSPWFVQNLSLQYPSTDFHHVNYASRSCCSCDKHLFSASSVQESFSLRERSGHDLLFPAFGFTAYFGLVLVAPRCVVAFLVEILKLQGIMSSFPQLPH